jgi:hypothetical protein
MPTYIVTIERIIDQMTGRGLQGRTTHRLEATSLDDAWDKARAQFYGRGSDSSIQIIAIEEAQD